jgi:hypothetical protein
MRLSDAIAMGRMLVPEQRRFVLGGCAFGMALKACGAELLYEEVKRLWPWTAEKQEIEPPCGCVASFVYPAADASAAIFHLFDNHVRGNPNIFRPWTLDQLIDWVRSVEPAEDEDVAPVVESPSSVSCHD